MTTYLLFDDAIRSYELRHEITEAIGDPILFLDHGDKRIVVGSVLEAAIFEKREDVVDEFLNWETFGYRDLVKDDSVATEDLMPELVGRVLDKLGITKVAVPPTFRLNVADYLRNRGLDLVVDGDGWDLRRRRKNPTELEGIERAQRATENAMLTAARMLREAEPTSDGLLRFSGEILTAELIREAMQAELLPQGAESEEILVQSGDACLAGHDIGHGPILPNQSCIIDCFPRDRRSGAYTDMTRTFVPGTPSDELKNLHTHVRKALKIAFDAIRPGRATLTSRSSSTSTRTASRPSLTTPVRGRCRKASSTRWVTAWVSRSTSVPTWASVRTSSWRGMLSRSSPGSISPASEECDSRTRSW